MEILLILAHPRQDSFNHALAETCRAVLTEKGHKVIFHDLCAEHFDPVLKGAELSRDAVLDDVIKQHCDELVRCDGLLFVHPNWWGMPPAILKGWIDRVVRAGTAYRYVANEKGETYPQSLIKANRALVLTTSNTAPDDEEAIFGDPLETLWKKVVFGICKMDDVRRKNFSVVITSTPELRKQWLREAADLASETFAD